MNLNELIDSEVEDEVKHLPEIESDDELKDFEGLNDLIFSPKIESLQGQIQTLEDLKEIKNYLNDKKKIDRKLSLKIQEVDNSFYNKRISKESFTEEPTLTNYQDTIVFLDNRINDVQNNALTILKEVLNQGLEQCESLYKKFTDEIQPAILKYYDDVCKLVVDNEHVLNTESILFFNSDKKTFYDAYNKYLKDILKDEFYTIEDSVNPIRAESFKDTICKIDDLLSNNSFFNKFIKIMVDHDKPVPIKDIILSDVIQTDITPEDIFLIFRGTKGHWYFSNMEYIIDYVINIIEFKSNDIKEMYDSVLIAQYMVNMREELCEIKLGLDFIISFIKNIFPFMRLCRSMFLQIGI